MTDAPLPVPGFPTATLGLLNVLVGGGVGIIRRVAILRDVNGPEPVPGGLVAAGPTRALCLTPGLTVAFIVVRNAIGMAAAPGFGLPAQPRGRPGPASPIGGHRPHQRGRQTPRSIAHCLCHPAAGIGGPCRSGQRGRDPDPSVLLRPAPCPTF